MFGFATWDENGVDNNTGFVKVNALGSIFVAAGGGGSYSFNVPPGYSLDFMVQQVGQPGYDNRKKIYVSGNSIVVGVVSNDYYGADSYPFVDFVILAFAR